eukprot:COSAG02_NODE_1784_length_10941_cov_179.259823_9_plen_62_part_00
MEEVHPAHEVWALDESTIAARNALLDARSNLVAAIELNRDAEERIEQTEDVFHKKYRWVGT